VTATAPSRLASSGMSGRDYRMIVYKSPQRGAATSAARGRVSGRRVPRRRATTFGFADITRCGPTGRRALAPSRVLPRPSSPSRRRMPARYVRSVTPRRGPPVWPRPHGPDYLSSPELLRLRRTRRARLADLRRCRGARCARPPPRCPTAPVADDELSSWRRAGRPAGVLPAQRLRPARDRPLSDLRGHHRPGAMRVATPRAVLRRDVAPS
jgi:hypothetical protein